MKQQFAMLRGLTVLLAALVLSACAAPAAAPTLTPSPEPTVTPTPAPTGTPVPTATPAWTFAKGSAQVPILLYHRIAPPPAGAEGRYYVSPEAFAAQMQLLHDWGYTAIPISLLVRALVYGAELPPRPVVITFDDGDISVYESAFPIMQQYGFTGVNFIVANRLQVDGYMNAARLQELAAAGWEVGSHSMTHADLRLVHDQLQSEGRQSKLVLEDALGLPVEVFAYPFGQLDEFVADRINRYGYTAAVGLGVSTQHDLSTLFYLSRREVENGADLRALLPWQGPPAP